MKTREEIENILDGVAMAADLKLLNLEKLGVAKHEELLEQYLSEYFDNIDDVEKLIEIDKKYIEILLNVA